MAGPVPPPYPPLGPETQPAYPAVSYPTPAPYPGSLPPPVDFPPRRRVRTVIWTLVGLALVGVLVVAAVVLGGGRPAAGSAGFTDTAAKAAIQGYLTALSTGDTETVARNTLCGMFDAVRDRRSDLALARLASDAFRKQFSRAEVFTIDKIVLSSAYQAQVLFTMKVAPTAGARSARGEEQAIAQVLRQDNQLLVCSYLLRTTAQY